MKKVIIPIILLLSVGVSKATEHMTFVEITPEKVAAFKEAFSAYENVLGDKIAELKANFEELKENNPVVAKIFQVAKAKMEEWRQKIKEAKKTKDPAELKKMAEDYQQKLQEVMENLKAKLEQLKQENPALVKKLQEIKEGLQAAKQKIIGAIIVKKIKDLVKPEPAKVDVKEVTEEVTEKAKGWVEKAKEWFSQQKVEGEVAQ